MLLVVVGVGGVALVGAAVDGVAVGGGVGGTAVGVAFDAAIHAVKKEGRRRSGRMVDRQV